MTGPKESVLGIEPKLAIKKMKYHVPVRFQNAEGRHVMNACLIDIDEKTGKTVIRLISYKAEKRGCCITVPLSFSNAMYLMVEILFKAQARLSGHDNIVIYPNLVVFEQSKSLVTGSNYEFFYPITTLKYRYCRIISCR